MLDWLWKNEKVETLIEDVKSTVQALEKAQETITKLTDGYLTLQTEISILREILSTNGFKLPVGAKPFSLAKSL